MDLWGVTELSSFEASHEGSSEDAKRIHLAAWKADRSERALTAYMQREE